MTNVEGNGRDERGRFAPGCEGGPGNPWLTMMNTGGYEAALREAVSIEDLKEVLLMLVTKAKEGDLRAARIIMERVLGKVRGIPLELEGEGWPL